MIGPVLVSRLSNQTDAGSRVFPQILPQNPTYPAITYQVISDVVLDRAMGLDGELRQLRVQVDAWAKTYGAAQSLASQVEARLSRFRGTVAGIRVLDVLKDNQIETYESEAQTRRVSQDFTIFVGE